jgi:hypothetical protein
MTNQSNLYIHSILISPLAQLPEFRIPVNPEKLSKAVIGSWADRDIIGFGEVSYPLYRKEKTIEFDSFFPFHYDNTLCAIPESELLQPPVYVKLLNAIVDQHVICRIIVTGIDDVFTGDYTLRKFDCNLQGGELGDIYYSVSFKEYREGQIRKFTNAILPTTPGAVTEPPTGYPNDKGDGSTQNDPNNPEAGGSGRPAPPVDTDGLVTSKPGSGVGNFTIAIIVHKYMRNYPMSDAVLAAAFLKANPDLKFFSDAEQSKAYKDYLHKSAPDAGTYSYENKVLQPGQSFRIPSVGEIPISPVVPLPGETQ